jgi:hypothetical protein
MRCVAFLKSCLHLFSYSLLSFATPLSLSLSLSLSVSTMSFSFPLLFSLCLCLLSVVLYISFFLYSSQSLPSSTCLSLMTETYSTTNGHNYETFLDDRSNIS